MLPQDVHVLVRRTYESQAADVINDVDQLDPGLPGQVHCNYKISESERGRRVQSSKCPSVGTLSTAAGFENEGGDMKPRNAVTYHFHKETQPC